VTALSRPCFISEHVSITGWSKIGVIFNHRQRQVSLRGIPFKTLISKSLFDSGDGSADRAGVALGPAAAFDLRQEIADDPVVLLRLLDVDRMAGVRDHRQRR